jgi:ATP-dependent DNA helicase RecG
VYGRGRANARELADCPGRSVNVSRPAIKSLAKKGILDWYGSGAHDPLQYYSLHGFE